MFSVARISVFAAGVVFLGAASAAPRLEGPVSARVVRVIDGDTVEVAAAIWLDQELIVKVRLAGIDAPEIFRPSCAAERRRGHAAKAFLESFFEGRKARLVDVRRGKYAGRVVARLAVPKGGDAGEALLAAGLAAPMTDGRRRVWCGAVR